MNRCRNCCNLMLDRVKKLNDLRRQSKQLESELEKEVLEVTHKEITVRVTGNMRLKKLNTAGKEDAVVMEAINKALKAAQKEAAKKMRGQLGGLSDLLG